MAARPALSRLTLLEQELLPPWRASISAERLVARLFGFLIAGELALVALDATLNYGKLVPFPPIQRLFNMAREDSLAAWLASIQTLAVGGTLGLVYFRIRAMKAAAWRARGWGLLAAFFTYLSVDDGAGIHERVGSAVRMAAAETEAGEGALRAIFPSYPWQLVFGPIFGCAAIWMLRLMSRELTERRQRLLFVAGLGCYVAAVGLDFLEGLERADFAVASFLGTDSQPVRHFGKVLEELLELLGTTFFLVTFLRQLASVTPSVELDLR